MEIKRKNTLIYIYCMQLANKKMFKRCSVEFICDCKFPPVALSASLLNVLLLQSFVFSLFSISIYILWTFLSSLYLILFLYFKVSQQEDVKKRPIFAHKGVSKRKSIFYRFWLPEYDNVNKKFGIDREHFENGARMIYLNKFQYSYLFFKMFLKCHELFNNFIFQ